MFVEQVVLKYEGMEVYARRLETVMLIYCTILLYYYLGNLLSQYLSDPDFLKASTINRLKKYLNSMDSELEKKKLR